MYTPGYRDRQPAGKARPFTRGAAVRSSQAQVHITNFDYNRHLLNTMPDTRLTFRGGCGQPALAPLPATAGGELEQASADHRDVRSGSCW